MAAELYSMNGPNNSVIPISVGKESSLIIHAATNMINNNSGIVDAVQNS